MVLPVLIGAALLSAASSLAEGAIGYGAAQNKASALKKQGVLDVQALGIQGKAAQYELEQAIAAGRLEMQAAGLDAKTSFLSAEGIVASTGSAIFDALLSGEIDARNFEASADAGAFNAKISHQLARNAKDVAASEASDFRRAQGARLAGNRVLQSNSGFTLEGSPMIIDKALFAEIELGSMRIGHAGDVESFRRENEAALLEYTSKNDRASAVIARKTGDINASYAREAGEISRKAALMGVDVSELRVQGAQIGIDTSRKKTEIEKATISINRKSSRLQTSAGIKAAKLEGISSLVGGVGKAASTIATSGAFG